LAFNRIVVLRYRSHLESRLLALGTINLPLGAVRRLAYEAADCGLLGADFDLRCIRRLKPTALRCVWDLSDRRAECILLANIYPDVPIGCKVHCNQDCEQLRK
jgi:hypothetical protein